MDLKKKRFNMINVPKTVTYKCLLHILLLSQKPQVKNKHMTSPLHRKQTGKSPYLLIGVFYATDERRRHVWQQNPKLLLLNEWNRRHVTLPPLKLLSVPLEASNRFQELFDSWLQQAGVSPSQGRWWKLQLTSVVKLMSQHSINLSKQKCCEASS